MKSDLEMNGRLMNGLEERAVIQDYGISRGVLTLNIVTLSVRPRVHAHAGTRIHCFAYEVAPPLSQ